MNIPEEAIRAAGEVIWRRTSDGGEMETARLALEAAAPHMKADADLMRWKLDALKKWADAMISESPNPQYGHDVRTILDVPELGSHEPF